MPDRPATAQALLPQRTEGASRGKPYTYPQPTIKTSASTPGSLFNRYGGSVLLRRGHNERLLVAGGWLGLGQNRPWNREEAHRLARIRLDIPNTADADWKIDIRKSTARPPVAMRTRLTQIAEDARGRARKVFAFRGSPTVGPGKSPIEQAWVVQRLKSGIRYKVDESHPAVAAVLDTAGPLQPMIRAMLRVIEETVPVQRIWLDTAENRETPKTGFADAAPDGVLEILRTIFADMVGRRGMSPDVARQSLLRTDPFQNFPALVAKVAEQAP